MKLKTPIAFLCFLAIVCGPVMAGSQTGFQSASSIDVPDAGWHLWLDRTAQWRRAAAFLPENLNLSQVPPHAPTGGWPTLSDQTGLVVTLPTTVEQHYWGVGGLRPYRGEYFYEAQDPAPLNGNYIGVSWWWRTIAVPDSFAGKSAILHIRAAKQLAEVYVNQKLTGYNLVGETSFDCDVTQALKPGQLNTIAIRMTNPGGRLDWGDWGTAAIGDVSFFSGHGFGGLDRGITLTAHGPVRFTDSWVLNTSEIRTVQAHAELLNTLTGPAQGKVIASVIDPKNGTVLASSSQEVALSGGEAADVFLSVPTPKAKIWDIQHPNLYKMRFSYVGDTRDERATSFGFRWFTPAGVGAKAMLRLNGKRIRVYSAISWGFWGINGLWPTPALAEKEVLVAKSIGLNALNFHRNIARAEALDAADRLGLLRYTEPGGGMSLFWSKNLPLNTVQEYMIDKIKAMVRDARSHPSLIMYVIQNELDDDTYTNPLAAIVVRDVHALDPSRVVLLKSGIGFRGEMWMMPYDDTLYTDNGTGYSGWYDDHSVGTPDSWNDQDYNGPNDFVYRNIDSKEVVDYGEMGGSGTADDHALMVRQIKQLGGKSYDLLDHEQIDSAYSQFLTQYGFRAAFPTTSDLYKQIGSKQFEYWQNVLQCARLSDSNDYLTVSGWDTTAVEDHGGLVDNLRNPHGDPAVIAAVLRPVLPAVELRKSVVNVGQPVVYDLYFMNETNRPMGGRLAVKLISPSHTVQTLGTFAVPAYHPDVFSYQVKTGLVTPPLIEPGTYTINYSLGNVVESRTINVVRLRPLSVVPVALIGGSDLLRQDLAADSVVSGLYDSAKSYSAAICSSASEGTLLQTNDVPTNSDDAPLYRYQRFGPAGSMEFHVAGLPDGPAKVTLGFEETYFSSAGTRIFDVDINGVTAIKGLDIFASAGGKDKVWYATIDTNVVDGEVVVAAGNVEVNNAQFNTIRVDAGGKTVCTYFGSRQYVANDGAVWQPYAPSVDIPQSLLDKVRDGMGLIVLGDDSSTDQFARLLASAGAFSYDGLVGKSRAPWMGSWYFVRSSPLYAGLPVNEVMKGDYQVALSSSDGVLVHGPNVQIVTAYSRDHSRQIGAGDVISKLGKGTIVFHIVPRMPTPFQELWLENAITVTTR